jgi:hypothetical protein
VFSYDGREVREETAFDRVGGAVWAFAKGGDETLWIAAATRLYTYGSGKLTSVIDGVDARGLVLELDTEGNASVWCRHASPRHVRMRISLGPDGDFEMKLDDDGRGFTPRAEAIAAGRGLANIRSRASLIDAEAEWRARPGGGTVFSLRKRG